MNLLFNLNDCQLMYQLKVFVQRVFTSKHAANILQPYLALQNNISLTIQ